MRAARRAHRKDQGKEPPRKRATMNVIVTLGEYTIENDNPFGFFSVLRVRWIGHTIGRCETMEEARDIIDHDLESKD